MDALKLLDHRTITLSLMVINGKVGNREIDMGVHMGSHIKTCNILEHNKGKL